MLKGVSIKDEKFKELEHVLESWIRMVKQYSIAHKGEDACYWYNERATLSVLAAAVWKTDGWIALEEFSTEKVCKKTKGAKNGRCDLYISSDSNSYACEAKQAWHKFEDSSQIISCMLNAAWEDASELANDEAENRLAICFCIPSFLERPTDEQINEWLKMCQKFNHVAFAYSFPHVSRSLKTQKGEKRIFPGVAVIIQHRQRGIKKGSR